MDNLVTIPEGTPYLTTGLIGLLILFVVVCIIAYNIMYPKDAQGQRAESLNQKVAKAVVRKISHR